MLSFCLALLLTAGTAISTNFTHTAAGSDGECHCFSNITIQIESLKESQCLLAEQLMLENERLKLELQTIKQNNDSEESSCELGN